jgi:hypothetical protein
LRSFPRDPARLGDRRQLALPLALRQVVRLAGPRSWPARHASLPAVLPDTFARPHAPPPPPPPHCPTAPLPHPTHTHTLCEQAGRPPGVLWRAAGDRGCRPGRPPPGRVCRGGTAPAGTVYCERGGAAGCVLLGGAERSGRRGSGGRAAAAAALLGCAPVCGSTDWAAAAPGWRQRLGGTRPPCFYRLLGGAPCPHARTSSSRLAPPQFPLTA